MPSTGIAGAFGLGGMGGGYGGGFGFGFVPYVGGVPFFHHKKRDEDTEGDAKPVDCDAITDPESKGHRDAVTSIAHVDDATHESILQRIKEEVAKL